MKSYTDLEQSKKLAEILPIESADMFWADGERPAVWNNKDVSLDETDIPAWSLAKLLYILNYPTLVHEFCGSEKEKWFLSIYDPDEVYRVWENDPIDACYEMILTRKPLLLKKKVTRTKTNINYETKDSSQT